MSNTKYTKDGKKVVVIGKLNSEEHIVQEIFVSGNQEIPGGENFVAKGLLDAPAESWKDKNLREKEESYDRRIKQLERDFESSEKRLSEGKKKAALVADALFDFACGTDHEEEIRTLKAFLCGEITHVFVDGYDPKILEWASDFPFQIDSHYGKRDIEAIRLVSVFGSSDGKLDYRISTYRDGSGSDTKIFPFTSREDAIAKAQEVCDGEAARFLSGENTYFNVEKWTKIDGININQDVLDKYAAQKAASVAEQIAKLRKEIEKLEGEGHAPTNP